ncbi:MAG: Crp/Fnr family transcriptional regulator [Bacteroidales bacterium]|jgi:CRP-like cAMP-binding protein|nr:Crp/Fnr family transcriptional regulator [Bacteroidales bacterium]MDD2280716.1 Crp/Fnr family transcriptional regulator [Bacteroidales bacterium]MDD4292963.1 Crp/Fnr family transcriptional regulator [Bacteroidales bacterium]MDD4491936.1 Crp/Fnr family transcriptional regulator [Bacteroidales bacterium]HNW48437.1 Crp/Fnr family transcriptional regulator [Bacteroidales bacterium]
MMNENNLSDCPLFRGMSKEEHDSFMQRNVKEVLHFEKGEVVVRQGDIINSMYLLIKGVVRTQMITQDGNTIEIDLLEAVFPLAPAFIYASRNKYPVDVVAMEPCTFLKISKSAWLKEMAGNEILLNNFLTLNSNMTVFLSEKLQMISIKSLRNKLSIFLLEKTTPEKNYFILKRSRTQLAEYFGVQRPSLARTIKELEDEGIISTNGRVVTVLERDKLVWHE